MFCKFCGKTIDDDSIYCRYCGKYQSEDFKNNQNPQYGVEEGKDANPTNKYGVQKKGNFHKYILYGIAIILLSLILWHCYVHFNRSNIADVTIDKVSSELADATKRYDRLSGFHEGLARVCKNKKYGFIDKLGHEIIPCKYDHVDDFKYGVTTVKYGDKEGIINKKGDIVAPCIYDFISSFSEDSTASASLNEKIGRIDIQGNVVIPFEYEECNDFCEGLACVRKDGLYGFINRDNKIVIPCQYTDTYNSWGFSEGLVGVSKDGGEVGIYDDLWGYIDKDGKTIIPFQEGLTGVPFSSGLSIMYRMNEMGTATGYIINKQGAVVIKYFEVQNLQGFRNGYCVIKDKAGWEGLIDTHGKVVIPCKYQFIVNGFDEKYVVVRFNGKYGVVNPQTGETTIPCIYEIDNPGWAFEEGVIPVKKDGKYGFINEYNQTVIPFTYDDAYEFSEGFAVVQRYGKYGYVDRYGHDTFN